MNGKKKNSNIAVTTLHVEEDNTDDQELRAKIELAKLIATTIKKNKYTQKEAADLIGIDQPKISAIIRGQLTGFTIDRLFRYLIALGMDITIEAKLHLTNKTPQTSDGKRPAIYVRH